MMSYRSAVHDSTKCTPDELMLGHNLRLPADLIFGHPPRTHPDCSSSHELYANKLQEHLDTVHEFARTNIQSASNKMKHYYDRRSDQTKFSHGEAVWLYNPKRKRAYLPNSVDRGRVHTLSQNSAMTFSTKYRRVPTQKRELFTGIDLEVPGEQCSIMATATHCTDGRSPSTRK